MDQAILDLMGSWVRYFDEAIRKPAPTGIEIEGKPDDFILKYENTYYLFCYNLPMIADPNVALAENAQYESRFRFADEIQAVTWMDNGSEVQYTQDEETVTIQTVPYTYGRNLVVRVAKIVCK